VLRVEGLKNCGIFRVVAATGSWLWLVAPRMQCSWFEARRWTVDLWWLTAMSMYGLAP
jgi:hypothetical protein